MTPAAHRGVRRHRFPSLVPDRARTEHRVELGLARGRARCIVKAVAHADTVECALRVTLDRARRLDAEDVEDRRNDVDRMVVLVAQLAGRLDALRPRNDARIAGAALELVALPRAL